MKSTADETMVKPKKKGSKIDGRDSQLSKSKLVSSMSPHGQPSVAPKQDFQVKRASTLRTKATAKMALTLLMEAVCHYN